MTGWRFRAPLATLWEMTALVAPRPALAFDDPNADHEVFFEVQAPRDAEEVRALARRLVDAAEAATGEKASTVTVFAHAQRFLVVGKARLLLWLASQPGIAATLPPPGSAMIKPVRKRPARLRSAGRGR